MAPLIQGCGSGCYCQIRICWFENLWTWFWIWFSVGLDPLNKDILFFIILGVWEKHWLFSVWIRIRFFSVRDLIQIWIHFCRLDQDLVFFSRIRIQFHSDWIWTFRVESGQVNINPDPQPSFYQYSNGAGYYLDRYGVIYW